MEALRQSSWRLPDQDLTFLGDTAYVYHCHHFNLFHDQTVEDALGEEAAAALKVRAAREAAHALLSELVRKTGASTPGERIALAQATFAAMGQGRLEIAADGGQGSARGEFLHYSYSWREKYGAKVTRREPIDAFAAGFAAAAADVAYGRPLASTEARETRCFVRKDPACEFELKPATGAAASEPVGRSAYEVAVGRAESGLDEERIAAIAGGLKDFVAGVSGDDRGLVQAFGVFVTLHLAQYYNQTAYDAIRQVELSAPRSVRLVEELFGESGHVCAFNTFGNILLSPEWEALVGPLSPRREDIVSFCAAIARGLGFGHWIVAEHVPGERLVMRASSNYEAPFYVRRYGTSERPRSYFFANAARAIMLLASELDWKTRPRLTQELYEGLFRSGRRWELEQTRCLTQGHGCSEVVVTRGKAR